MWSTYTASRQRHFGTTGGVVSIGVGIGVLVPNDDVIDPFAMNLTINVSISCFINNTNIDID